MIGFLAPVGSHSHEVAETLKVADENSVPLSSSELRTALQDETIERVVLPIENSGEGGVRWVLEILAGNNIGSFGIIGELVWDIKHFLLGFGALGEVRRIFSHPQALGQCRRFTEELKGVETEDTDSTSAAVKLVAGRKDRSLAAIGTRVASRIYGVPIIQEDIGDHSHNQTRFIILGEERTGPTGDDKTSLVFGTEDKPGTLYRALEVFDVLHINMTMILSQPSPSTRRLGEYIFFVDVEGHQEDRLLGMALEMIEERVSFLKILGSFPKAKH